MNSSHFSFLFCPFTAKILLFRPPLPYILDEGQFIHRWRRVTWIVNVLIHDQPRLDSEKWIFMYFMLWNVSKLIVCSFKHTKTTFFRSVTCLLTVCSDLPTVQMNQSVDEQQWNSSLCIMVMFVFGMSLTCEWVMVALLTKPLDFSQILAQSALVIQLILFYWSWESCRDYDDYAELVVGVTGEWVLIATELWTLM